MKAYLLAVAVALLPACGKKNDVAVLEHEAVSLATYYEPKLAALDARVQKIFEEGRKIPGNLPGIEDVGKRLQEAKGSLDKLRGIVVAPPGQPSALEKQAEAAAKEGKVEELQKLVHDTETALDHGITVINDNLDTVEGWIEQFDSKTLAIQAAPATPEAGQPAAAPPAAAPPETAQPRPVKPEAVNTPQAPVPAAPKQPAPKQ